MKQSTATLSVLLLLVLASPAGAEPPDVATASPLMPQMQNGISFLTGGIGDREQERLRELDDDYSLRVALTRADGAYLADVKVVIEDKAGHNLVETTTRGPILLADLAPGRYLMRATFEGRMAERRVIDIPKDRDQVRLFVAIEEMGEKTAKTARQ